MVVITGMNPTRWVKPGEKAHWRVIIHVRASQPIRPYTSVHVDWTHRSLAFVNMPLPLPRTGDGAIGIDRGCVHTLALSDGTFMDMPKPSKAELKRLKHLRRKMARQDRVNEARGGRAAKFVSKRRRKTLNQFNALQGRIVRRRNDWIEKTTTRLARENSLVAMEDLDVQAMTKRPKPRPDPDKPGQYLHNGAKVKAGLDRSIQSNCWGRISKRLQDKMDANGGRLAIVPAAYTSQTCHKCGHVAKGNRESQAVFRCVECGYRANADVNAAMNILSRALIQTGGAPPRTWRDRNGGPMKRPPLSHRPEVPLESGLRRESPGFSRGEDVKHIHPFPSASSPATCPREAPICRSLAPLAGLRPTRRRMAGIAASGPHWAVLGIWGSTRAVERRSVAASSHSPWLPPTHKALVTLEKTSRWNRRKGQGATCPQRICLQAMRR